MNGGKKGVDIMLHIKTVEACYTGGGIYMYYGELSNGNWFLTGSECKCDGSILELDADPADDLDESGNPFWQETHKVRDLNDFALWNEMILLQKDGFIERDLVDFDTVRLPNITKRKIVESALTGKTYLFSEAQSDKPGVFPMTYIIDMETHELINCVAGDIDEENAEMQELLRDMEFKNMENKDGFIVEKGNNKYYISKNRFLYQICPVDLPTKDVEMLVFLSEKLDILYGLEDPTSKANVAGWYYVADGRDEMMRDIAIEYEYAYFNIE